MHADLTESVYAMIVLAYATLAVSSYLFNNIDQRTQVCRDRIDSLIAGPCQYLRQANLINGPQAQVISRYDNLLNKKVSDWRPTRWPVVPYMILASVVGSALLLIPVLLIRMELKDDGGMIEACTRCTVLLVQVFASITVPLLALNVRAMIKKIRPLEKLRDDLELAALPGQILLKDQPHQILPPLKPKATRTRTRGGQ